MKRMIMHTIFLYRICTGCLLSSLYGNENGQRVLFGIECITKQLIETHAHKKNPQVGLITNQTGRTMQGLLSIQLLQKKQINVTTIFSPEHGYWGTVPAGQTVKTMIDPITGISVISLYDHGAGKKITAQQLKNIDVLIFDMQDSGMRHYTYISSLYKVMEACKTFSKPLMVCDRPNPLGGFMEGPLVEPSLQSFISIVPVPLRHGMTMGELALYFNARLMNGEVPLHVVAMKNYTRKKEDFSLLASLSPNLPTVDALYGYSFLGLMGEIKPFDVGVGTPFAFQRIGLSTNVKQAPLFFAQLEKSFKKMQVPVKRINYTNQKNKKCVGLQFLFKNTGEWSTMQLLYTILREAKKTGIPLTFSPAFNKAFGSDCLQKSIQQSIHNTCVAECVCKKTQQFYEQAKQFFLYKPHPQPL